MNQVNQGSHLLRSTVGMGTKSYSSNINDKSLKDAIKNYLIEIAHCVSNAELGSSNHIYPIIASKCNYCYSFAIQVKISSFVKT